MKNADVELIQRVLNGDDTAFSTLVKKYQKSVHALAWRKIGDFHIAEDITQETFLKAYQRLSTLKEPQSFASWLYVIATNHCNTWLSKKRLRTQSLESTSSAELEKATYSNYVIAENEWATAEAQREVVKKLLAKLQESDRTVITLYYLGGMTYEEISRFLGVSVSAIKNRLYRARQQLKKEETMIREALENYQISPNLTNNIMQEVARLKPAAPSGGKPLVPWVIGASSLILIALMLGIGSQYLARFQKPYSLDAQAETTVELVEAPIVLNVEAKSDVRNFLGSPNALDNNNNRGERPDEVLLAAAQTEGEDEVSVLKQQWIQSKPIEGTMVEGLFAIAEGVLYTLARGHIYKLQDDSTGWRHISDVSTLIDDTLIDIPMAEWDNTLYILPSNKLYASKDGGKTWNVVHQFPEEYTPPKELMLMQHAFYIVFERGGAFRSEDRGKTWKNINKEFPTELNSIVSVQDTVFALAGSIYRWDSDSWQRLAKFPVPEATNCYSITATNNKLYAFVINHRYDPDKAAEGERGWWIFRSTDLGNSWKNITPTHVWKERIGWLMDINLYAAGETLLAVEQGMVRSTDGGDTWMPLQKHGKSLEMFSNSPATVLNESIFYFGSPYAGLQRSTDDGKSWDAVNVTSNTSYIGNLIVDKENDKGHNTHPIIYGSVGDMVQTTDKGKSWKTIPIDMPMEPWHSGDSMDITQIVKSGGFIYAKGKNSLISAYDKGETHIFHISTDGKTLVPIQGMPIFDPYNKIGTLLAGRKSELSDKLFAKQLQESSAGATQFFIQLVQMEPVQQDNLRRFSLRGAFAVSGTTFYMEYNYKLFRWEHGETAWHDIGQEETIELPGDIARKGLKLAASGNTVYVGKRDGHLVVSFDKGNNWIDITQGLPFTVNTFNNIVIAGATVYVATDAGSITSDNGRNWRAITDAEETNLIMEHLAVDGTTLYGITKGTGIYRLENGTWKQVVSEIPDNITSLAVDGNTLYVGTQDRGMLHFNLEQ